MNTESLSTLKIHKLTQAQYDRELEAGNLDKNALYLTPDELELDATLTQPGVAADAKAVGDALEERVTKKYVDDQHAVSYGASQDLDKASRETAKNNIGVYVGSEEPVGALDGDIWVTDDANVATVSNIHLVDASSDDLSSIDFSKYAVGDIILVTSSMKG